MFDNIKFFRTPDNGLDSVTSGYGLLDKFATSASSGAQYGDDFRLVAFGFHRLIIFDAVFNWRYVNKWAEFATVFKVILKVVFISIDEGEQNGQKAQNRTLLIPTFLMAVYKATVEIVFAVSLLS